MSTPHVLKGWTTREWQKALELAYAVEGEDPEMHVVGGTYVEVGRNAQGPYVEVNSADSKGRDLRVRRVYMKPKPTGEAKRKPKRNHKLRRTKAACSLRGRQTRLGNGSAASHLATHCPPLGVRKGNAAPRGTTEVILVLQGNYGSGWNDEAAYKDTKEGRAESRADIKAYRENAPGQHRIITRRVNRTSQEPVKRARKGNDAAPKVRVLSMKKKTRTIRGVGFHSYEVSLQIGSNKFVTIEADANRYPVLPESISDGPTREAILHAVQHYRSGR